MPGPSDLNRPDASFMLRVTNGTFMSMNTSPQSSRITRRRFLGATATSVAAFTLVPRHVLGGAKFVAPSNKVNVALVGVGGQGRTNCRALFNEADAQVMAGDARVASELQNWSRVISEAKIERQ